MEKEKIKYTLPFVNKGEPFEMPPWTVKKHKVALKEIKKREKDLGEKRLDEEFINVVILKGLHNIDPNVTAEDLNSLHPDDLSKLFNAVFYQGKTGIVVREDFRDTKKKNLSRK